MHVPRTIWATVARMTHHVPAPAEPDADAVWAEVHAMLGETPVRRPPMPYPDTDGRRHDVARMTRRQELGFPLGKHRDPAEAGLERARTMTLDQLVASWGPVTGTGQRKKIKKPKKITRPTWCRQCGRLTSTCATIGECS
jgi:hypothetical protein